MKARTCPHCGTQLKIEQVEYYFSENLSLMCVACDKVVFPTNPADELAIDSAKRSKLQPQHHQGQILSRKP